MTIELLSPRPRTCRFSGAAPGAGTVLRARRAWYVVISWRPTRSADYPVSLKLGRISEKTARSLVAAGADQWAFAWDRGRKRRRKV